jgi:hypothetical protein
MVSIAGAETAIVLENGKPQQALLGELAPGALLQPALLRRISFARIEVVGAASAGRRRFPLRSRCPGQIKIHFSSPAIQKLRRERLSRTRLTYL